MENGHLPWSDFMVHGVNRPLGVGTPCEPTLGNSFMSLHAQSLPHINYKQGINYLFIMFEVSHITGNKEYKVEIP